MANATSTQLQELYVAYFGRAADPTGLDYWTAKGITQATFAADMYAQAEFKDAYGSKSVEAQVNQIYKNLFDREADVTGLTYWTQQINIGTLKVAEIATHLIWAAQNNSGSESDKTALTNRTNAAVAYTAKVKESTSAILAYSAESTDPWVSGVNITEAISYMSGIDGTTSFTSAGIAASVSKITTNGVVTGTKTHSLATTADTITGTDVKDVFNGATVYSVSTSAAVVGTTSTYTVADEIKGGAGIDTFNLSISGAIDGGNVVVPTSNMSSVEKVFVRANATEATANTDSSAFNAALYSGITEVWTDRSTSSLVVTGLESGAKFGLKGNTTTVMGGTASFAYATALDDVTLTFDGGVQASSTTDIAMGTSNALNATITSTGAANEVSVVDLTGGSATITAVTIDATTDLTFGAEEASDQTGLTGMAADAVLTITGAGAVSLETLTANIDNVNASANSGGVTVVLGGTDDNFTGGSGNDDVTLGGVAAKAIIGGAGTDTIRVGDSANVDTSTEAAFITGFETLTVIDDNNDAESYDTSLISGITAINIGAVVHTSDDVTLTKLTSALANALTMTGDNAADLTITLADATGTADTATLTMGDAISSTTEAYDIAETLVFNDIETLNLVSTAGASAVTANKVATIDALTSDDATTITMTGNGGFTFTDAALTKAATYDASAIGGVLSIAGTLIAGSTVTGGAGNDTLTIDATGSTWTGGAGNDTFTAAVAGMESSSVFSTIAGGAGTDTLAYTDAAHTVVDSNFKSVTGLELITMDMDAAATALSFTTGGFFATAFSTGAEADIEVGDTTAAISAATYDLGFKVDLDTEATGSHQSITTGGGNDTIIVNSTAATTAKFTIVAGAGNDSFTYTRSAGATDISHSDDLFEVDMGLGKDTISFTGIQATETQYHDIEIDSGESLTTSYDEITGYAFGDTTLHGMILNFTGSAEHATAVTNIAVAGYTSSELLLTSSAIGLVTWAGTSASGLTLATKITSVQTQFTATNDTVAFVHGSDSYVFHNNSTADSLVKLVGVSATGVDTGNTALTVAHIG